jgi:uncharacterized protein YwqG
VFLESEILKAVDLVLQAYRSPSIMLHRPYPPTQFPPVRSRLGGLPLLPDAFDWPQGRRGDEEIPLHFLAQIDCSELPRVDQRMPSEGFLFFFARDDEEQRWTGGKRQDSVRVVYAPSIPQDQRERSPPPGLPPIRDRRKGSLQGGPPWPLPEEPGPSVHASWPLAALRVDSWPDYSAIVETQIFREIVSSGVDLAEIDKRIIETLLGRRQLPRSDGYRTAATASRDFSALYARRVNALRLGAVMGATGLPTRAGLVPNWGETVVVPRKPGEPARTRFVLPADRGRDPKPFPQVGVMVDRIARLVTQSAFRFLAHRSDEDWERKRELRQIETAGRHWIARAEEIGWDAPPSDADRNEFVSWLDQLAGDGPSSVLKGELRRIFSNALASSITYAAGSPRAAALIPPYFYNVLENHHLPFRQEKRAVYVQCGEWRLSADIHQMLGHAPSGQDVRSVDDPSVLLLRLFSDGAVNMEFGATGAAAFWIKPDDLIQRRFDKAWGEVVGR